MESSERKLVRHSLHILFIADQSLVVSELAKLFSTLTTTRATCTTPEVELARLTLEKAIPGVSEDKQTQDAQSARIDPKRRRSTLSGRTMHLSKMRGGSISSIATSPTLERKEPPEDAVSTSPSKKSRTDSNVSIASTIVVEEQVSQHTDNEPAGDDQIQDATGQEGAEASNANRMSVDGDPSERDGVTDASRKVSMIGPPTKEEADNMTTDNPPPVPPRPIGRNEIEHYAQQQDVEEVMGNVFHQLQWAIRPQNIGTNGNQEDMISKTFWGTFTEHSKTKDGKEESQTTPFHSLFAYANEPCDIYEALSTSLDKEVLEDRSAYWTIDVIPPVMHFIIPRVLWDTEKGIEVRNANQVKLHPHIYLDRFMSDESMTTKRQLYFTYRDTLRQRKAIRERLKPASQDLSIPATLDHLSNYLKDLKGSDEESNIDLPVDEPALHECIGDHAREAEAEIKRLDSDILELQDRMEEQLPPEGKLKYCLQAIFVHRGSARSGHWFTYMYDAKSDKWRKYNDESVDMIDSSRLDAEIFSPDETIRGAASVVVYAREDERLELFEPVHRLPDPEPEPRDLTEGTAKVRSQQSEMPPANIPYEGASAPEHRSSWDKGRDVADSNVAW